MRAPTAEEQLFVELINRARADPAGELDRLIADPAAGTAVQENITAALDFFDVDIDLLYSQLVGVGAAAPLAWSEALAQSAYGHTILMIEFGEQSHNLPGEPGLGERITQAGYTGWTQLAENVFAYAIDVLYGHAAYYIDWGNGPGGIQSPAGHRNSILSPTYTEVGIGHVAVNPAVFGVGPGVNTQHFGTRAGTLAALTGVAIDDADGDGFYDIGEGLAGVTVRAVGNSGAFATTTYDSGGYRLDLPDGTYSVTFEGGDMVGAVAATAVIAGDNVKLDARAQDAVDQGQRIVGDETEGELEGTLGNDTIIQRDRAVVIDAADGNDRVTTGSFDDMVLGGGGADVVKTADGNDEVQAGTGDDTVLSGTGDDLVWGESGDDVLKTSEGDDTVHGGAGNDTIFAWRGNDIVTGGPGDDVLRGDFDDDRIEGGPGEDRILGGPGRDTFVFRFGFQEDRLLDYNPVLEKLDFSGHDLVNGYGDLSISQIDSSVVITTPDDGRIVLADVDIARISEGDFIF
ncbi:MAG: CAP domain-containing protein [Pseudomonadota bacterium]